MVIILWMCFGPVWRVKVWEEECMVDVNLHCCHHAQEDLNSCVKLEFALIFCILVLFVIVLVEIEHRQSTPPPSNYSLIFSHGWHAIHHNDARATIAMTITVTHSRFRDFLAAQDCVFLTLVTSFESHVLHSY